MKLSHWDNTWHSEGLVHDFHISIANTLEIWFLTKPWLDFFYTIRSSKQSSLFLAYPYHAVTGIFLRHLAHMMAVADQVMKGARASAGMTFTTADMQAFDQQPYATLTIWKKKKKKIAHWLQSGISTTCAISMWNNLTKCKYIFTFPWKLFSRWCVKFGVCFWTRPQQACPIPMLWSAIPIAFSPLIMKAWPDNLQGS